jgi:hypothetical protein
MCQSYPISSEYATENDWLGGYTSYIKIFNITSLKLKSIIIKAIGTTIYGDADDDPAQTAAREKYALVGFVNS